MLTKNVIFQKVWQKGKINFISLQQTGPYIRAKTLISIATEKQAGHKHGLKIWLNITNVDGCINVDLTQPERSPSAALSYYHSLQSTFRHPNTKLPKCQEICI